MGLPRLPAAAARRAELFAITLLWLVDIVGFSAPLHSRTGWGSPVPAWLGGLLVTLTYVAALLRYRRPLAVLIGLGVCTVALPALLPDVHSFVPMLFALNAVASRLTRRVAVAALAGALVVMVGFVPEALRGSSDPAAAAPFTAILYLAMTGGAWALGIYAAEGRARRAAAAGEAAAAAVSAERLRVARELHDIVAHAVSVMVVQAAGARRVLASDPQGATQALTHIESAGKQSMEELRRMLGALRGTGEDDGAAALAGHSLADLPALVAQVRAAGTGVVVAEDGRPGELAPSVALAAYRVVQEALTNTTRHAGVGATAAVLLTWSPDRLRVSVDDVSGATPREGLGLNKEKTVYHSQKKE